MKLAVILARELADWPEGSPFAWQDHDREVRFKCATQSDFFASELAEDNIRLGFESNPKQGVTRAEWQAAVEALKAEQAAELKWPDGAEFMGTTKEGDPKVFYRNVAGDYEYRYEHEVYWSKSKGKPVHTPLIPRPTERAVEWDGSSFPPQYTICEWRDDETGEWRKVKVLYLSATTALLEFPDEPGICEGAFRKSDCQFRPIRTQEQIAAEDREKAIEEMILLDEKGSLSRTHFCGLLYDAGYARKQVAK